jgi:hypothetical protein
MAVSIVDDIHPLARRIGLFSVGFDEITYRPDEIAEIFAFLKIVVLRAEMRYDLHAFEYMALCHDFDVVPNVNQVPHYRIVCTRGLEGSIEAVKVERV